MISKVFGSSKSNMLHKTTHHKRRMDLTRDSLPSFLLIFLLKKLFDFLRFTEIWDHGALVIIQPQPDVFADLSTKRETTWNLNMCIYLNVPFVLKRVLPHYCVFVRTQFLVG